MHGSGAAMTHAPCTRTYTLDDLLYCVWKPKKKEIDRTFLSLKKIKGRQTCRASKRTYPITKPHTSVHYSLQLLHPPLDLLERGATLAPSVPTYKALRGIMNHGCRQSVRRHQHGERAVFSGPMRWWWCSCPEPDILITRCMAKAAIYIACTRCLNTRSRIQPSIT